MIIVLILCVLWFGIPYLSLGLLHRCPPGNTLSDKCLCNKNESVRITCNKISDARDYREVTQSFRKYVVDQFITKDSSKLTLLSGSFKKLYMKRVTFENVQFDVLPMLVFLDGLEESLEEIIFLDSNVEKWIWERGTHFGFLKGVTFEKTPLPSILTDFILSVFPKRIRTLTIIDCKIESLGEKALRRFSLLKRLQLKGNKLSSIQRSSLPLPAKRLRYINLSNNPLKTLPEDLFTQMRLLEVLHLSYTQLHVLNQKTFQPIWEQLAEISFKDVLIECGCETSWLLNITSKQAFTPPSCKLSGNSVKLLTDISLKELCQ